MFANLKPRVLVVDDEPQMRSALQAALEPRADFLRTVASAHEALNAIESGEYDIVISDMYMPGASGLDLLNLAQQSHWDVAVILITGRPEVEEVVSAMRMHVSDFLFKPLKIETLTDSLDRTFHRLLSKREARDYRTSLETSLQRRTLDETALSYLETNYSATLNSLVAALDAREHETCAHSFRVRAYTAHLARLAGYPPSLLPQLENAALLHDIGKIAISDTILLKRGKLTDEEFLIMKQHTWLGQEILQKISFLQPAAKIIRHHHERFDGNGYPDGLAGEDIPLGARIFGFADTLDAMTSDRCYRAAPGVVAAREEIIRCTGKQFDPKLTEVFLKVSNETWNQIRQQVEDERFIETTAAYSAEAQVPLTPARVQEIVSRLA
ncbi:MAG: response regulator receiver (CheY-like) modulated metal dependent phosphohydrolase [Acidobacteriales bacterium]|nr:response regulator receiver (CheY-like) modulated metal dependent phosphohydrolase [Terriglobales bacterium]